MLLDKVVEGAVVKGTEMLLETLLELELVELSVDEVDVEVEDEVDEEVVVVTAGTIQTLIHSLSSQISGADPVSAAAQAASSAEVAGSSFPHQHSREYSIPK